MSRKLIVANIVSVDGAFTGPGGDIMAMPFAEGFSEYNAERLRAASTLLLGRTTFEGFRDYWPPIAEDESQPELEREISRLNGAMDKVVVSDTLTDGELGAWPGTEIVAGRTRGSGSPRSRRRRARRSSCSAATSSGTTCSPPASSTSCT